jgi:hypothetical protein
MFSAAASDFGNGLKPDYNSITKQEKPRYCGVFFAHDAAWRDVITAVFTMSCGAQPRDKSLAGFLSP